MGVDYDQKCMVGIEVDLSDITVVVSDAVYEDQNRYDPRTGKILKTEKMLVKAAKLEYVFMGKESDDWYCMIENIAEELGLDCYVPRSDDEQYFYIGTFVGEEQDMGNVDMLTGSVEINYLVKLAEDLKSKLSGNISLHFLSSVG